MKRNSMLVSFFLITFLLCTVSHAAPVIEVTASSDTLEKGHTVQMFVTIRTDENLHDVVVSVTEPEGFSVEAVQSPGQITGDAADDMRRGTVKLQHLAEGSSVTVTFRVWAPDLAGNPKFGEKQSLYSTRELKEFPVNVVYTMKEGAQERTLSHTEKVSLRYTTSIGHYIIAGLFGVFLGFIVKTATQYKSEIDESLRGVTALGARTKVFLYQIFLSRLPLLMTLMIVGFGVLLSLAKDGLPVTSWHQAIALGIGIGVLSDEQLITKIKRSKI